MEAPKMEAPDFFIEDLLDLSNGGDDVITDAFFDSPAGISTDSSSFTPVDSCHSSVSDNSFPSDSHFSGDLSVPYDELAELEWLSNFVEESFSTDELHKLQHHPVGPLPSGPSHLCPTTHTNPLSFPAKARSKRSRVAPCDWSTRLLMVSPATSSSDRNPNLKKRETNTVAADGGEVRRCFHCAADKTPQWRTGPMGPKTLCNACGVRYKSGRLVPEYRPAASPTYVPTKHSNSHRKVMELRKQKEIQPQQHHQQFVAHDHHHQGFLMGVSNGCDDYLMSPHHMGPDYPHMI